MSTAAVSMYAITGEPGAFDQEAQEIFRLWGRPLDEDPLVNLLERWMFRLQPCGYGQIQVNPADMQHLQRTAWPRMHDLYAPLPVSIPLFGVPVLVDARLDAGLVLLERCRTGAAHEGCRMDGQRWLDAKVGAKLHSRYGCALGAVGISNPAYSQCLDGTEYTYCGARECEGYCDHIGTCDCCCHA